MRLFEAIVEANHRAVGGDASASLRQGDWLVELPVAALTCIDARLNPLIPEVLGIAEEHFIWLRNAGNIITGPMSSTARSLALACAVKGAKEIVIIGHTDCQVAKTTTMELLERFKKLGIERHLLPDNINEYFGMFASERQNVIKGCEIIRQSALIGPKIPVHGILLDIKTGKIEWLVNGYQKWGATGEGWNEAVHSAAATVDKLKSLTDFKIGDMKFPETKIGETVAKAEEWLQAKIGALELKPQETADADVKSSKLAKVAEQAVHYVEKHWPKSETEERHKKSPPRIPTPPPIRVSTVPSDAKKVR